MASEILQAIEAIGREKGIATDVLIEAVEAALVSAAHKNVDESERIEAHFDRQNGRLNLFSLKRVVESPLDPALEIGLTDARRIAADAEIGEELEISRNFEGLGRIAAQTAKQVIFQRVRDAERENIYAYYIERQGQLVNGSVLRVDKGNYIVDLGRAEAILPKKEQSPRDAYRRGDRIRAYLMEVRRGQSGPQVVLSRTHTGLLQRLFEMEVPEIYEGIVEIKGAVREPGDRAKICVISNDSNVDPVGACVGMKGSRVQSIVKELRGENIDIIEWTDDTGTFISHALSPAQVLRIHLDAERRLAEVLVSDQQLSLAIGKKGQNVRLAAKLTGWRIDIKSESDVEREVALQKERVRRLIDSVSSAPGLGARLAAGLVEAGYDSFQSVAEANPEDLMQIAGLGPAKLEKLRRLAEEEEAWREDQGEGAAEGSDPDAAPPAAPGATPDESAPTTEEP